VRSLLFAFAVVAASAAPLFAQSKVEPKVGDCGEVVAVETHGRTSTRYALAQPNDAPQGGQAALVLLAGGGGHVDLDRKGCVRALKGNFLVRSLTLFHRAGFSTALVDAPSDHPGEDGLKGFRIALQHADDLGKIIADLRKRAKAPVWVVGTSRGTISAANAAARLSGSNAPDGVVLTSAVMSGGSGGRRPWATQTVFDFRLEAIAAPVLVVGHASDNCPRTPARLMGNITARTNAAREQVVTVSGGPGGAQTGLDACQGRTPHGFVGQEAAVVAGIARFIRGDRY
jgi:pimeloyl-ACP methyl ester carboxylesterase